MQCEICARACPTLSISSQEWPVQSMLWALGSLDTAGMQRSHDIRAGDFVQLQRGAEPFEAASGWVIRRGNGGDQ